MRIGISLTSAHATQDPRAGARWMIERARAANDAGLDSLFVGDHHATPIPYYQNTAILGRLLAEWGERPAGALYLLPLHHPVLVAEHVGTLASIARGRFILQCAIGPDDNQFPALGLSARTRPSRFEASLALIRALWNGETVNSDGPFAVREARISPRPPEPV
jgi:alkanesulfonate monooxygenase SsuD/methylene tetrahydromethanopterin reductase-like flavin-dependent oxidoreductase (luciferase family)